MLLTLEPRKHSLWLKDWENKMGYGEDEYWDWLADQAAKEEIYDEELSKLLLDFHLLVKKGKYKDNQEDFQKFINIEWGIEERLQKKREEHLRLNGE